MRKIARVGEEINKTYLSYEPEFTGTS